MPRPKKDEVHIAAMHQWDIVRDFPTEKDKIHEVSFRSYQILAHVKSMLYRGDSTNTIKDFIHWCEGHR